MWRPFRVLQLLEPEAWGACSHMKPAAWSSVAAAAMAAFLWRADRLVPQNAAAVV
jgi:hypothetical protein